MNKPLKTKLITGAALLGSVLSAHAAFTSQGTVNTSVSATVEQQAANIEINTAPLSFAGTLALPTEGADPNYYATDAGGDGTGVGSISWNATLESTWEVRIYTENTNDSSGLQSEIVDSERIDLKFTNENLGGVDTALTADGYGDDTDGNTDNALYQFVPDINEPTRSFAQTGTYRDIVTDAKFRFATKVTDAAIGGTYSTTVIFDLLIDIQE